MAGSRRWFGYTADSGVVFGYELDESTYENAAFGMVPVPPGTLALSIDSDRPLRPRYVNVVRVNLADETLRAKFYVGTTAALAALVAAGQVTVDGEVWGLSSYRGEQRKIIPLTDTEQLDGDVDSNYVV